jgi:DNA-binding response OmpR family regulator
MVTSKDYAQDRYIAKQLGALDFVIKPLRFKEIRELVCKHAAVTSVDQTVPAPNESAENKSS